jgi:chromosome segregation ATPase
MSDTQQVKPTPAEVLNSLERAFHERNKKLNQLKDSLSKLQTQVLDAQGDLLKAFQEYSDYRAQYLNGHIRRTLEEMQAQHVELTNLRQLLKERDEQSAAEKQDLGKTYTMSN